MKINHSETSRAEVMGGIWVSPLATMLKYQGTTSAFNLLTL